MYGIVFVQFSHTYCFAPDTETVTLPLLVALEAAVTVKVFTEAEEATTKVPSVAEPDVKSRVTVSPIAIPCLVTVIVIVVPDWLYVPVFDVPSPVGVKVKLAWSFALLSKNASITSAFSSDSLNCTVNVFGF